MSVFLGILVLWLVIAAAIYAALYRRVGARIEKRWKRAAFLLGWSAALGPGLIVGHGIAPAPAGIGVLSFWLFPNRDQLLQGTLVNLVMWAITIAACAAVAAVLRRRAT